jgi:tetratricopeptide (TPR) repeat protein
MKKKPAKWLIYLLITIIIQQTWAQSNDTQVANQYFAKHDYEKAFDYYKKLIKKSEERNFVYTNYLICATKLGEQSTALKQLDKLVDENPTNVEYKVDKAILLQEDGKTDQSTILYEKLKSDAIKDRVITLKLGNIYALRKLNDKSIDLYLSARKAQKNNTAYARELATQYKNADKTNELIDEWLNMLENNPEDLEEVQNEVSINIIKTTDQDTLLDKIYQKISDKNQNTAYNQLMVVIYMQRKDFYNAFVQLRSIDKKESHYRGTSLIELGDIAVKNKDYTNAIIIYNYVTETYPNEYHYEETKNKLIQTKEIQVKQSYPIDTLAVQEVIADYDQLLLKSKQKEVMAEILLSQAELYALYLNQKPKAKELIKQVSQDPRQSLRKQAEAKLLMGDILILEASIGEAMLEYMQVERMIEDDDLGHIAKLKTAKSFYYDGDFELAQEQLDILKRATTRKIANDAQDLSLLIKGNYDLDTSHIAMTMYAQTELMIVQKKYEDAKNQLDQIAKKFPNHSLTDELHYQRAQIYEQTNDYLKAVEELKEVIKDKEAILSDDAMMQIALLYDYKLRDYVQAKEFYKQVLLEFPGSIYVAEARKRYYEI